MTRPLDPATAGTILALVAAAQAHAPEAPLAWLCGYAARASGEPISSRPDPRSEPPETNGTPIARVQLTRRG
jgi:hypothetical protein